MLLVMDMGWSVGWSLVSFCYNCSVKHAVKQRTHTHTADIGMLCSSCHHHRRRQESRVSRGSGAERREPVLGNDNKGTSDLQTQADTQTHRPVKSPVMPVSRSLDRMVGRRDSDPTSRGEQL